MPRRRSTCLGSSHECCLWHTDHAKEDCSAVVMFSSGMLFSNADGGEYCATVSAALPSSIFVPSFGGVPAVVAVWSACMRQTQKIQRDPARLCSSLCWNCVCVHRYLYAQLRVCAQQNKSCKVRPRKLYFFADAPILMYTWLRLRYPRFKWSIRCNI